MTADELLRKLEGVPGNTPIVYEFGTYEGSVTDAELYEGADTDGRSVLVLHCEVPE